MCLFSTADLDLLKHGGVVVYAHVSFPARAAGVRVQSKGKCLCGCIAGGVVVVPTTISASLTQQIFGPIRAKVDARLMPMGSNGIAYGDGSSLPALKSTGLGLLETSYGLDCALPPGGASRLVVWYSPQRREGMAEVRFLET